MPAIPVWVRPRSSDNVALYRFSRPVEKFGRSSRSLSNRLNSDRIWPSTLDKESNIAARILRSFCKTGFYDDELSLVSEDHNQARRVLKKIPTEVIKNAVGLAICTIIRGGPRTLGGGSGVLLARKIEGTWSPPSGLRLHTAGLSLPIGVDVYDCILVMNNKEALETFSRTRCTIGADVSAVAGPIGVGGIAEGDAYTKRPPVYTYTKSRGLYTAVQMDGTVVTSRTDENARFYREKISVTQILAGEVRYHPRETSTLSETLKAAQGDFNLILGLLPNEPSPADYEIARDSAPLFSVPSSDDPDPYGVKALEVAGVEIREAGSHRRASSEQFDFTPKLTSPVYSNFRRSIDCRVLGVIRTQKPSHVAQSIKISMTDSSTQTDLAEDAAEPLSGSNSPGLNELGPIVEDMLNLKDEVDTGGRSLDSALQEIQSPKSVLRSPKSTDHTLPQDKLSDNEGDDPAEDDPAEEDPAEEAELSEVIIEETATHVVTPKARLITLTRRAPPELPPRNPGRQMKTSASNEDEKNTDAKVHGESLQHSLVRSIHSSPATAQEDATSAGLIEVDQRDSSFANLTSQDVGEPIIAI